MLVGALVAGGLVLLVVAVLIGRLVEPPVKRWRDPSMVRRGPVIRSVDPVMQAGRVGAAFACPWRHAR